MLSPSQFMPAFAFGAHAELHLMHLGWVAQVGGAGIVRCGSCGQDNEVYNTNVSNILGRDVSWDQFRRLIHHVDWMLALEKEGNLPLDSRVQEGPIWLWYTLGYPREGQPSPAWWIGFGDSAHCVSRMDVEVWLVQAREWEARINEYGWESMVPKESSAEEPEMPEGDSPIQDPILDWLRGQMGEEGEVEADD